MPVLIALLILAAVVALVHWPVLSAQAFTFDDHQFVFVNPRTNNPSWQSAWRFISEVIEPSTVAGYYKPLTMITLMLDVAAGGTQADLRAFHVTNLLLHVGSAVIIALFLWRIFAVAARRGSRSQATGRNSIWIAAFAALLWAVHPLTVEPLAWVAERKTMLASFFAFAALLSYVSYVNRPAVWRYALCAVCFVLSLLGKPTTVPLPVLLLLLDYWPLRRLSWRAVWEKTPLLAVAFAFGIITILSQKNAAGLESPAGNDPGRIFLAVCHNLFFYFMTTLWPVNLSWYYPYYAPFDLAQPLLVAGLLGTPALLVIVLLTSRWTRSVVTASGIFFLAIAPTLGIVGFSHVLAAHKFTYFPLIGPLLLLPPALSWLWTRTRPLPASRLALLAGAVAVPVLLAVSTRAHLQHWQTTEQLHRHMLAIRPGGHAARVNFAKYLAEIGRVDEALAEFERVITETTGHWKAHSALGTILKQRGNLSAAETHLDRAVQLNPQHFPAVYNLAQTYAAQNRSTDAIAQYEVAIALAPNDVRPRVNLANELFKLERFEEALSAYEELLAIHPDYARGHYNRGLALERLRRWADALAAYDQALLLQPDYESARERRAVLQNFLDANQP